MLFVAAILLTQSFSLLSKTIDSALYLSLRTLCTAAGKKTHASKHSADAEQQAACSMYHGLVANGQKTESPVHVPLSRNKDSKTDTAAGRVQPAGRENSPLQSTRKTTASFPAMPAERSADSCAVASNAQRAGGCHTARHKHHSELAAVRRIQYHGTANTRKIKLFHGKTGRRPWATWLHAVLVGITLAFGSGAGPVSVLEKR